MTSASKDKPEKQKDKDSNVSGPHSTFLAWPAEVNDKKEYNPFYSSSIILNRYCFIVFLSSFSRI